MQPASAVTCCILPLVSVNLRSTNFTSLSLISFRTSAGFAIYNSPYVQAWVWVIQVCVGMPGGCAGVVSLASDRLRARLACADAYRFLNRGDEDLAVADAAGLGRPLDGLDRP